ncbi:histidine phosphatase family protein [Nocardioides terrisoli]|uniref:histidine phosphatase family protein n=1 Tax=Nocardioides terrisoli TaxID=3388267 RepID=UPI00287B9933|nr:histidine phosphatase family protein [Nocardioides marmorisolisilvae]
MAAGSRTGRAHAHVRHIHLVRHGRPLVRPDQPAASWHLDPAAHADVVRLRESGRLPTRARWFTSPEPKARETAALLTDAPVEVVDDLAEQVRMHAAWIPDLDTVRRRAFAHPAEPAYDGWEPLADTARRVGTAARALLDAHPDDDLVIVGHATAFAVLAAALTGRAPDPDLPGALGFPDVVVIEMRRRREVRPATFRDVLVGAGLVGVGELVSWRVGGRLGLIAAAVLVLGTLALVTRRSRHWGWTLVGAALLGIVLAIGLVVAVWPRTGG